VPVVAVVEVCPINHLLSRCLVIIITVEEAVDPELEVVEEVLAVVDPVVGAIVEVATEVVAELLP
jgi:NAD kinase